MANVRILGARALFVLLHRPVVCLNRARASLSGNLAGSAAFLSKFKLFRPARRAFLSQCVPERDTRCWSTLCPICSNPFSCNELSRGIKVVRPLLDRHQWINGSVFVVRA